MAKTHLSGLAISASGRLATVTDSTATITDETHEGLTVVLDRAAGIAVTLPAATGGGGRYTFIVKTTITSNSTTIKVVGNDIMVGFATLLQDGGDTSVMFETASDSDTITFNGTTTGGVAGAIVQLIDIALDTWHVQVRGAATGTEATPFSATVS